MCRGVRMRDRAGFYEFFPHLDDIVECQGKCERHGDTSRRCRVASRRFARILHHVAACTDYCPVRESEAVIEVQFLQTRGIILCRVVAAHEKLAEHERNLRIVRVRAGGKSTVGVVSCRLRIAFGETASGSGHGLVGHAERIADCRTQKCTAVFVLHYDRNPAVYSR